MNEKENSNRIKDAVEKALKAHLCECNKEIERINSIEFNLDITESQLMELGQGHDISNDQINVNANIYEKQLDGSFISNWISCTAKGILQYNKENESFSFNNIIIDFITKRN